jgi:hypothetical protein
MAPVSPYPGPPIAFFQQLSPLPPQESSDSTEVPKLEPVVPATQRVLPLESLRSDVLALDTPYTYSRASLSEHAERANLHILSPSITNTDSSGDPMDESDEADECLFMKMVMQARREAPQEPRKPKTTKSKEYAFVNIFVDEGRPTRNRKRKELWSCETNPLPRPQKRRSMYAATDRIHGARLHGAIPQCHRHLHCFISRVGASQKYLQQAAWLSPRTHKRRSSATTVRTALLSQGSASLHVLT